MGKKIWLFMHPRNFGSDKIVRMYLRPPLHVSWAEILHFKHRCFLAVNCLTSQTFREKKQQQSQGLFSIKF